jgi:outer membrane immunogenic protein
MKSIRIASRVASLAAAILALPLAAHAQSNSPWQGPYAGINAGGLFSSTSATIGENNAVGGLNGNGSGFMGGAQAGYNWMLGSVMLGGEVDFQGSTETTNLFGGAGSSQISATSAIPWFSTFRARVGYPVGSVMPYVTGGAVWGHQTLSGFDPSAGGNFSASNNFWTYVVGVGMEGRIAQAWTAKLEYLWIGTPDTALSSPASTSISERSIGNVVRVGLNYHF